MRGALRLAAGEDLSGALRRGVGVDLSAALVEKVLGTSAAFSRVDKGLYVVKQGSSYVMISVIASGPNKDRALVRVTAQVVSGVRPESSLFRRCSRSPRRNGPT